VSGTAAAPVGRILVREVNWLGDAVLTLPALAALDRRFPQAEITILAKPWVAGLLRGQPGVDRVIEYDAPGLRGRWELAQRLRPFAFELAVLFPNSLDAALIPWLAGIPRRVGFGTDCRTRLLTDRVPLPEKRRHQVFRYLRVVEAVGASGDAVPVLRATPEADAAAERLLKESGVDPDEPFLALNPGSIYGDAKRWLPERFAAAADRIAKTRKTRVLLIGSAKEGPILEAIGGRMQTAAVQLGGRTDLTSLIGILRRARLLVTNDTGAMHVAAAIGTPVLTIIGPTDPIATGPLGARTRVVQHPVPCSPCLLRTCPIDHRCMERIEVEDVVAAAEALWQ